MIRDNRIQNRQISPAAYLLGDAAEHLPQGPAFELFEAVSHILAAPSPVQLREGNLGLVIDMIRAGTGEFVKYEDYDALRKERQDHLGEEWPSSTTLCDIYFGWLYVVRAAMEIYLGRGNVHRRPRLGVFENQSYTRAEIDNAIKQCRNEIGFWPSEWEYSDWSYLTRQIGWDRNNTPRIPGVDQIRRKCGSFDEAVEALAAYEDEAPPTGENHSTNPETKDPS